MAAYQTTWGVDNNGVNALTSRSLNNLSSNLSNVLTGNVDASFELNAGAVGTTYTVTGSKPTLVVVAIRVTGEAAGGLGGLTPGDDAVAQFQILDGANGVNSLTTIATYTGTGAGALNLPGAVTGTGTGIYLFNSGGQYRVNQVAAGGGVAITGRYEVHLDNFHPVQTFIHEEEVNSYTTGKFGQLIQDQRKVIKASDPVIQTPASTTVASDNLVQEMSLAALSITGTGALTKSNAAAVTVFGTTSKTFTVNAAGSGIGGSGAVPTVTTYFVPGGVTLADSDEGAIVNGGVLTLPANDVQAGDLIIASLLTNAGVTDLPITIDGFNVDGATRRSSTEPPQESGTGGSTISVHSRVAQTGDAGQGFQIREGGQPSTDIQWHYIIGVYRPNVPGSTLDVIGTEIGDLNGTSVDSTPIVNKETDGEAIYVTNVYNNFSGGGAATDWSGPAGTTEDVSKGGATDVQCASIFTFEPMTSTSSGGGSSGIAFNYTGSFTSMYPLLLNPNGFYNASAGTINGASTIHQLPLSTPDIDFEFRETNVGNKLRNLDRRAFNGVDHTQTWTRTTVAGPVTNRVSSANFWTIVIATGNAGTNTISVNGTTRATTTSPDSQNMLITIVGPNDSYTTSAGVTSIFEWTVPGQLPLADL